jgi:hypothetical protein
VQKPTVQNHLKSPKVEIIFKVVDLKGQIKNPKFMSKIFIASIEMVDIENVEMVDIENVLEVITDKAKNGMVALV